jgi:ssDNA-binding Zn-finger/Zn-ribbon topoisomerase 1
MLRCPELNCQAPMVKRRSRYGSRETFYGCSEFPKCRATLPVPESELMRAIGAPVLPGFESIRPGGAR